MARAISDVATDHLYSLTILN